MARIKPDRPDENLTFESAMSQIDQIVRKLEGNSLGLDAALGEYAKAVEHVQFCQQQLAGARRKIEKLRGITKSGQAVTETWEDDSEDADEDLEDDEDIDEDE
jgi:exodeoxyribonuclease VII small subunit